ncbi:hypothetical protein FQA39_LY04845 [Lamprigera yunnana]|nr:hypothetical protein FQA39_LY04845 [Lamprigera yunnana]
MFSTASFIQEFLTMTTTYILLSILIVQFVNTWGEQNASTKRIIYPRQTQVSFTNFPSTQTFVNDKRQTIPFLTAAPRVVKIEENYFQNEFTENNFPNVRFTENYPKASTPNIHVQEDTIRILHPETIKTTVTTRKQPVKSPVSYRNPTTNLEQLLEHEWSNFKNAFNKTYNTFEEERYRREIFIENRNKVSKFNQEYGSGLHTFVQKLNNFADLLHHEFNKQLNGFNRTITDKPGPERTSSAFIKSANVGLPESVNWKEIGAVTSVKNQGTCGACYAFAAAGALEGQMFRRSGYLINLSPQNLIDCTEAYTNNGCIGGVIEYTYEYIKDNKGIDTEDFYPYEGKDGFQCRYRPEGYGAHTTGYILIDENDEQALEMAVATIGPVAVAIDASQDSFQFYSDGVYFDPQCKSSIEDLNHAVLVVGFDVEPNGQKYWLIKNSYGSEWGIGGYMKIAKFSNNLCGIASYASYPLV